MGQRDILEVFFENPTKNFQIRGIAKSLNIPKTTVSYQVGKFLKEKIIVKDDKGVFPRFRANESSENYRFLKKQESVKSIMESGLLNYIEKELNPRCIILFGSFAKGEHDAGSDVDIFVQARESRVDIARFEKKLRHKVNLLFEPNIDSLSPELLNNIVNGVMLRGFLKIR